MTLMIPVHTVCVRWLAVLTVALVAATIGLNAQTASNILFTKADRAANKGSVTLLSTKHSLALNVDLAKFRTIAAPHIRIDDVPVSSDVMVDLELNSYTLFQPGTTVTFTGEYGPRPIADLSVRLYRGKVVGDNGSSVFLAISNTNVTAAITTNGKDYDILTDMNAPRTSTQLSAIAFPSQDRPEEAISCGLNDANLLELTNPHAMEDVAKGMTPHIAADGDITEVLYTVVGAWDADYEYFSRLFSGDKQAAADYMVTLIGRVSSIYERDLKCQLTIGYMNIWESTSAPGYPYTEASVMQVALGQSRTYWSDPARNNIERGFAHVFSGKAWTNPIGISFLDVLCVKDRAVGFSAITFTNQNRDQLVVAHEIGHTFGSKHTHDCSWGGEFGGAIDRCAAAEGGSCFTGVEQQQGTIMSYCSQKDLRFHEKVRTLILEKLAANNRGCLILARSLSINPQVITLPTVLNSMPIDTTVTRFFFNPSKDSSVTVTSVDISGTLPSEFEILEGNPPFTLAPGEEAILKVEYKATIEDQEAVLKLTFQHNGQNGPIEVTINGFATTKAPNLKFVDLADDELNWGERFIGTLSDTVRTPFYTNLGNAVLYANRTEITGRDKLDFQIVEGTAPFELPNLSTKPAALRFSPQTTGEKEAWLEIESNHQGEPGNIQRVKLRGFGKQGGLLQIGVADLFVDFGDVEPGINYDTTFTNFLYNAGGSALSVTGDIEGQDAQLFSSPEATFVELDTTMANRSRNLSFTFSAPTTVSVGPGVKRALLVLASRGEDPSEKLRLDTVDLIAYLVRSSSAPNAIAPDERFYIAPNPTSGDVSYFVAPLTDEFGEKYTVSVIDAEGREVYRERGQFGDAKGADRRIPAGNWASGVYYITVSTKDRSRTRSVTITH